MPTYDFCCQYCGEVVERVLTIAERNNPGKCVCGGAFERMYTSRKEFAHHFDPVVVHYNPKTGQYRIPGAAHTKVPRGFERQELHTISEVRKVQGQINASEYRKVQERIEREHAGIDAIEQRERPALRAAMAHMTPFGREFARYAMDRGNANRPKSYDPGVHLDAFEYDSSNRSPEYDGRRDRRR